jgi:hypothetical protein
MAYHGSNIAVTLLSWNHMHNVEGWDFNIILWKHKHSYFITVVYIPFPNPILFISALMIIVSFILILTLICSSSLSSLRYKLRLFVWDFYFSLKKTFIIVNFMLRLIFYSSLKFVCWCFHFCFCKDSFKFSFYFSFDSMI